VEVSGHCSRHNITGSTQNVMVESTNSKVRKKMRWLSWGTVLSCFTADIQQISFDTRMPPPRFLLKADSPSWISSIGPMVLIHSNFSIKLIWRKPFRHLPRTTTFGFDLDRPFWSSRVDERKNLSSRTRNIIRSRSNGRVWKWNRTGCENQIFALHQKNLRTWRSFFITASASTRRTTACIVSGFINWCQCTVIAKRDSAIQSDRFHQ
jgi:hypothetical protein